MHVLFVMGTRPEAIKLAPLVKAFQSGGLDRVTVCATGQHEDLFTSVIEFFDIPIDVSLNCMKPGLGLVALTASLVQELGETLSSVQPDIVVVQGDTLLRFPTLVAPGAGVFSAYRNHTYAEWSGTSQAAPLVSGLAALLMQRIPDASVSNIYELLIQSCRKFADVDRIRQGHGMPDLRSMAM